MFFIVAKFHMCRKQSAKHMRNEKISEKVENGGKKNKIVNLFHSIKHAHFIWTPLNDQNCIAKNS